MKSCNTCVEKDRCWTRFCRTCLYEFYGVGDDPCKSCVESKIPGKNYEPKNCCNWEEINNV